MGGRTKKLKQEKADGGLMFKGTSSPFLIIEAKKPDVAEKKKGDDLIKIANNLKTAWASSAYNLPLFGVHVAGQYVAVYIFFKAGELNGENIFAIVPLFSFVVPDRNEEFFCLPKIYSLLKKTEQIVKIVSEEASNI